MSEYTMGLRLCDNTGMVSREKVFPENPFNRTLTYMEQLNNLRRISGHAPYGGEPFSCTGSAHLAHEHIRCTNDDVHCVRVPADHYITLLNPHLTVSCPLCGAGVSTECDHARSRDRQALKIAEEFNSDE